MNVVIDTRVSPQMQQFLLANRQGKLHADQKREVVVEPVIRVLLLLVPAIILLRSYIFTLFVGGLWMIGAAGLAYGAFQLFRRSRRYARIKVYYGVFHTGERLPAWWVFWRPITLTTASEKEMRFVRNLAASKRLQPNQDYIVYYVKENNDCTLLSFAPVDHPEIDKWKP